MVVPFYLPNKQINPIIIYSLPVDPSFIENLIKMDKKTMACFHMTSVAINTTSKYKNKKQRERKLKAVKNEFTDAFLIKYLKQKSIIINIIVGAVSNYWKNANSYDNIMKELDILLNDNNGIKSLEQTKTKNKECEIKLYNPQKPRNCNSGCRGINFGMCFCRDENGDYYY